MRHKLRQRHASAHGLTLFLTGFTGLTGLTGLTAACAASDAPLELGSRGAQPPLNVILVMTDDQGWGDLSLHGNPVLETPHLDRLAAESVRLQNFYVHPVCTPTRAALMTGRHPQRTGAIDTYRGRAMMRPGEVTIAEALGAAGWETGLFGKWHLGDAPPMRPMDQGFDRSVVHRGGGIGQPSDPLGAEGRYTDPILMEDGTPKPFDGYCTDVFFQEAQRWMAGCRDDQRPFLCVITPNAPHTPLHDVPEDLRAKYAAMDLGPDRFAGEPGRKATFTDEDKLARLYAMVENIDENMGGLCRFLETEGLAENTLLLFLCDNGPQGRRYNAGLRNAKGSVYEGGVRSPLFARWPGNLEPGGRDEGYAAHVDLFPTVLEACGAEAHAPDGLDGRSALSLLRGDEGAAADSEARPLVIQWHRGDAPVYGHHAFVRLGEYKLVQATRPWAELESAPAWAPELYRLPADPFEESDLAGEQPQVVGELTAIYARWFDDVVGPGARTARHDQRVRKFLPPPASLGETPVTLTIQDWRPLGEKDKGWGKNGRWRVQLAHPGPLRATLTAPRGRTIVSAELAFEEPGGGAVETRRWTATGPPARALSGSLEGLPALTLLSLTVTLQLDDGTRRGPHQVEVAPPAGPAEPPRNRGKIPL